MSYLTEGLNEAQFEAVTAPLDENLLVLAGAGSGKTRVLVHRIAWLAEQEGLTPYQMMAVTFTNKASSEMRERLTQQFGISAQSLWMGTFHGLSHRILRMHAEEAGLPQDFQVIDSDDQYRLIKRIMKSLNIDESRTPPKTAQYFINKQKDALRRAGDVTPEDPKAVTLNRIYEAYEKHCNKSNLIDFAELIFSTIGLWRTQPDLLIHYQTRFKVICVDEFQDTNEAQYIWLTMLKSDQNTLMVVGDDDQSIYGWRGAKIENLNRFHNAFSPVTLIRLQQNYRSTQTILDAANAVISQNKGRLGKSLWSSGSKGEPLGIYHAYNEIDEANFVVATANALIEQGVSPDDCAILYRSNAQSRVMEEACLAAGTPYRVYGGMRFFERQEIKNTLAYGRLIVCRTDDAAFERVVNTPARGIGERTVSLIRETAIALGVPMWDAAQRMIEQDLLAGRAKNSLQRFIDLIAVMASAIQGQPLVEQMDILMRQSGLWSMYQQETGEKARARSDNLAELLNAAQSFSERIEDEHQGLTEFLSHAVMEAGETDTNEYEASVQLMTLHASKGLEFPIVFIVGMEERLFPTFSALDDPAKMEEERRLCYVGITRAMQKCYLCYAESRQQFGRTSLMRPSRFIDELPQATKRAVRLQRSFQQQ